MGTRLARHACRDDIHRICRLAPFLPHALFSGYPAGYAFSGLTYAVLSLFFCDPDMHPSDFSLLVPRHEEEQVERPDEDKMLMQKAAGLAGGVRFGGDGGRDILSSADVADVMVDDAALMMASAGIPGGVRYVPAGW
ncbi:phage tail assembly protein T [Escherichia coli]|uniref:phage tail assembly protein T n=1 Tax=Escherichia coli TaxID=562 RepID=UPI00388F0F3C